MTPLRRIAVLLALVVSLVVAGCGGDDEGAPIPSDTATALNGELNGVQARIDQGSAGACRDILEGPRDPNMARVQELIASMPDDVDPDVRSALEDSFDRLWDLVQQECDDKARQEEEKSQQEPEPEPEEPTQTETQTETTPTETQTTETTPPEQEELPPDGDGDSGGGVPGNGNGNGNGNGGGFGPGNGE